MARDVMIVAGFGFRSGAPLDALRGALAAAGGDASALATASDKVAALAPLGAALGVPVIGVAPQDLAAQEVATHSAASLRARGTGSVAEAAALAACGPGARLIAPRAVSSCGRATCALAEGGGA